MKIPYGQSNFAALRAKGLFYVDKTPFIPLLESDEAGYRNTLLLRPRRFGKSLLVSMLEHYYDLGRAAQFDELFRGLWIHEHPTDERNKYLVLSLDFSNLTAGGDGGSLRETFCELVKGSLRTFFMRYGAQIPQLMGMYDELKDHRDAAALMGHVLGIIAGTGYKLYLLIDEYDGFANRLLAEGKEQIDESVFRGTDFVRSFYAALKAGTGTGAFARIFITGVSPILLEVLSSGFNIITHISQHPRFNTMAGFTRADVERAVDELLAGRPRLRQDPRLGDRGRLLEKIDSYYGGYRFCEEAIESVFDPGSVIHLLAEIDSHGRYPRQMFDFNVRTDYVQLQRVAALAGVTTAKRRALLESILADGRIASHLVVQFGPATMRTQEQLTSLLYYTGMLTFDSSSKGYARPRLVIPNRMSRELHQEYLTLSKKKTLTASRASSPARG